MSTADTLRNLERDLARSKANLALAKERGDASTIIRERTQMEIMARRIIKARYRLFGE